MSKSCPCCGFVYSKTLVNHTAWCRYATVKDWPQLKKIKKIVDKVKP